MNVISRIKNNRNIVCNVLASLGVRGGSMLLSLVSMPLYMRLFNDHILLGVWFTMLTVLSWILTFDLGIGNGLRNNLTQVLSMNNVRAAKEYISSAYILFGSVIVLIGVIAFLCSNYINWNTFFNIPETTISLEDLKKAVNITFGGILISFVLKLINPIFYALQQSAVPNMLMFITTLIQVSFLLFYSQQNNSENILIVMSWVYFISINIPPIIATFWVFKWKLKGCRPNLNYFVKDKAKKILSLGMAFFVLQILYMIISTTNEFFITRFFSPSYVVEYQIYIRIFSVFGNLFSLALIPVWSAVTKAFAEKRYGWIVKLYSLLNKVAFLVILVQIFVIPFLNPIIKFWLGREAIAVDYYIAIWFAIYSFIMIWIAVQSSIVAGLGKLQVQLWNYAFAVVFKVGVIWIVSMFTDQWISVIIVSIVSLFPYCIIQPIYINRVLKEMKVCGS